MYQSVTNAVLLNPDQQRIERLGTLYRAGYENGNGLITFLFVVYLSFLQEFLFAMKTSAFSHIKKKEENTVKIGKKEA